MQHDLLDSLLSAADYEYAYPWVLWLLLAVPLLAIWELWPRRRRVGTFSFTGVKTLAGSGVGRGWRVWFLPVPPILRILALALIIVAIARPQEHSTEERRVEGIDIFLVLDMSGSMQAVDLTREEVNRMIVEGETPSNRFDTATEVIRDFIESRQQRCNSPGHKTARCDRIGMVVFGKDAFLEFPLTLDYGTIKTLLNQRELQDIDGSGTAIGNAIARAVAGLRPPPSERTPGRTRDCKSKRERVVVMITDGDRRGGDISPAQAASMANHCGVKVFPILVGREGPTLLPNEANPWGLHNQYSQVEFPVNPQLLEKIATMTNGRFYRSSDKHSLQQDLHDILDQFERTEVESTVNVSTAERYEPWAFSALFLLVLGAGFNFLVIRKFP